MPGELPSAPASSDPPSKLTIGVALAASQTGIQIVRNVHVFLSDDAPRASSQRLLMITVGFSVAFAALVILWTLWFAYAVVSTKRALAALPYASTRFQQLCYRFFVYQQVIVVAFVVGLECVPIVNFISAYLQHPS